MSANLSNRRRSQRGSVTIQLVILMPALFAVMFLGLQAALYHHARAVALAAAQEGARDAGAESGTREAGVQTAREFVRAAGGSDVMTDVSITGSLTVTTASVTVTGISLSVIPGWRLSVRQSASVPVERLTE